MAFPDWSLILNEITALTLVLAPLEIGVLFTLTRIRQRVHRFTEPVEDALARFVGVETAWYHFKDVVEGLIKTFGEPANRQRLISEAGHGMVRVFREAQGSLRGIAAKEIKAQLVEGGDLEGLLDMAGGAVDLPLVGKTKISQLPKLLKAGRQLLGGAGTSETTTSQSSSSGGGQPP